MKQRYNTISFYGTNIDGCIYMYCEICKDDIIERDDNITGGYYSLTLVQAFNIADKHLREKHA